MGNSNKKEMGKGIRIKRRTVNYLLE